MIYEPEKLVWKKAAKFKLGQILHYLFISPNLMEESFDNIECTEKAQNKAYKVWYNDDEQDQGPLLMRSRGKIRGRGYSHS